MTFAEMCKETRAGMKLTQKKFAELIGSNQTEISFIERGFVPSDREKIRATYELAKENKIIT